MFLEGARQFLVDGQLEFRGFEETQLNPTVFFFNSPTEVIVGDCQLIGPEYGVYEIATGERTDDEPPVTPGRRDAASSTMLLEDGRWKIEDTQIESDFACEFDSAGIAVPVIDVGGIREAGDES